MSTNCYIGLLQKNGKVKAIYSHWDGYPEGVGKTLLEHYTDVNKIEQLLKLGSISCLGEKIGQKHNFDTHQDNKLAEKWTLAYHRDRKEPWDQCKTLLFDNVDEFLSKCQEDYTYLFQNNEWTYRNWDELLKLLVKMLGKMQHLKILLNNKIPKT